MIINDFPWLVSSALLTKQNEKKNLETNELESEREKVKLTRMILQVKLYWKGALACHGYLIDELWLICSSECFGQSQEPTAAEGWSAEISYEHYGNHDYQSIESNRRAISQVLFQPAQPSEEGQDERAFSRARSAIVLAKLEKPVRFR